MLDSEPNSNATDHNEASGRTAEPAAPAQSAPAAPAVPAAVFQAPQVLFQPPAAAPSTSTRDSGPRDSGVRDSGEGGDSDAGYTGRTSRRSRRGQGDFGASDEPSAPPAEAEPAAADAEASRVSRRTRGGRGRGGRVRDTAGDQEQSVDAPSAIDEAAEDAQAIPEAEGATEDYDEPTSSRSRRRRRSTRSRVRTTEPAADAADAAGDESDDADAEGAGDAAYGETGVSRTRRRRKRRRGSADADVSSPDDPPDTVVHVRAPHNLADDVRAIKGSTRLEAKKQRRREGRESGRRRPPVVTESEFLARRESVERTMVVRQRGDRTQIAVLEDGVLVEHYVNRTTHQSYVGNVYLGKVQNVLPSMEAAFVDIGKGRNAVLYAGEVNFDASGLEGQPKRIESALKPGQSVIVQVTKDPVGHKGARLTSQISLPGRYLVYVPGASMTGISRKLPDTERTRLKHILKKVTPENAGVIVRTAAEGAAEAELDRDVTRLAAQWEQIEKKAKTASAPALLYGEPDLTIRVVRDVFNEDFAKLMVSGDDGWEIIDEYVKYVAPHLADRLDRWADSDGDDVFAAYRVDEQLAKALERKVWLPSGGSLVIDRTEAMTVIDVNTGKFTGQGGNLEETVTRNNLEAAEEIVRQLRLRDVGGIVVIDFIDMVLESNRELVLRRLLECLARDRTKHQVAEVTSLGLVQMTRKRVGAGLLEAFSQPCECCNGRGVVITMDTPEPTHRATAGAAPRRPVPAPPTNGRNGSNGQLPFDELAHDEPDLIEAADLAEVGEVSATKSATEPARAEPASNGASRTRRPTAGGTAFATVVQVSDEPLVTTQVVVPVVESPAPAPSDPDAAPVRRTRAGSAVARVSVITTPAPEAEPEVTAEVPEAEVSEAELSAEVPEVEPVAEAAVAAPEAEVTEPELTAEVPEPTAEAVEPELTAEVPEPAAEVAEPEVEVAEPAAEVAEPEATDEVTVTEPTAEIQPEPVTEVTEADAIEPTAEAEPEPMTAAATPEPESAAEVAEPEPAAEAAEPAAWAEPVTHEELPTEPQQAAEGEPEA
jgi:ribonuclease E